MIATFKLWLRRRKFLREPLVHFLFGGVLVFLFFALRGQPVDPASRTIIITEEQVARLGSVWARTWQRPPTPGELDGLIRDSIREEIYYREAVRLGLDQDDIVIRRRLRSKMEFLARAKMENVTPTTASLQVFLDKNPQQYAFDPRYSFDQLYIAGIAGADSATARQRAGRLLQSLEQGAAWQKAGDAISLPASMESASRSEVARLFGDAFADALAGVKIGEWQGPIVSGFGLHLVRIRKAEPERIPELEEIRQRLENDWRASTVKDRQEKAYQILLDSYDVRIKAP